MQLQCKMTFLSNIHLKLNSVCLFRPVCVLSYRPQFSLSIRQRWIFRRSNRFSSQNVCRNRQTNYNKNKNIVIWVKRSVCVGNEKEIESKHENNHMWQTEEIQLKTKKNRSYFLLFARRENIGIYISTSKTKHTKFLLRRKLVVVALLMYTLRSVAIFIHTILLFFFRSLLAYATHTNT